ncbi:P-loop containing nucleoside triphosphate hydrolase protein [Entophlyctis helioformis]|nr:P-loop containing nucleoside triphosphate hydrolase protein [Entophlyctis helioformis]
MAMSGASQLRPIPWRAVVLDEAHRLKNRSSKVCEILKTYTMEHRVLLTGTPLQNSLDELWALLNFLEPAKFASEQDFKVNYGSLNTAADVERLQALLKPLMLRRLKEDVEKSIPVKEETIVEVELTTTQKKWYRSILEKNFSWLKQGTSKKSNVPNLINTMIELRKCCIHPWLLKGAEEQILEELHARTPEQQFQALIQSSGKMVLIDKLLKKLKQGGHKVLIFSQMTKCLDLIQDYLRLRGWLFERIDGGVRSDLRQASIDRFSAPGSDSFVFLLCTRAGGVGINLTAADTCIIFDSDWNPQNDLQAQSRCHRIGQKKTVQIYRLVTRNTYEREMFDRASLKLGLDRAVLQRMDAQSGGFSGLDMGSSKHTGLTAEEIEDLLKKGAYGAFMDDEASKQFCEEDIDQILERRTQVIRHNATEETGGDEKSSIFSKQAEFTLVEEAPDDDYLIMDAPRSRRQVNRYGQKNEPELIQQQQEALEAIIPSSPSPPPAAAAPKPKDEIKLWSLTERTRLERILMQHGFNNWRKIRESFPRRSVFDLQACCRVLLKYCLEHSAGVDPDVIKEVKRALECFPHRTTPPPDEPTEEDVENRSFALSDMGEDLDPEDPPEVPEDELPYPGATERQKLEFLSFCSGDNRDFTEHIGRKSKNILIRVALLFNIRNKCDPKPDMFIPKFLGAPPAPWWGDLEDKHIMMGICKHGYQQKYNKIWDDPAFCFKERFRQAVLEGKAVVTAQAYNKGGSAQDAGDDDGDDAADVGAKADVDAEGDIEMQADAPAAAAAAAATGAASGVSTPVPPLGDDEAPVSASAPGDASAAATPAAGAAETFLIPSATDLGVRVRRIINAMSKHRHFWSASACARRLSTRRSALLTSKRLRSCVCATRTFPRSRDTTSSAS